jgi:disulfide bond formation protein DsbB
MSLHPAATPPDTTRWALLFIAWVVALVGSLAVLFIGEVMGQAPCVLCWFQRAFLFPLAVVLAIATFRSDYAVWRYALPLAVIGWMVAAYHVLLYAGVLPKGIEPCGQGPSCTDAAMTVFGVVPIPALSLAAFSLIAGALILVWRRDHE